MNISDLLQSTITMGYLDQLMHGRTDNRRGPNYTFSSKAFGAVYYNNIVIAARGDIIEISLVMGTATDIHKSAHRIGIALKGVNYKEVTEKGLIKEIVEKNPYSETIDDNFSLEVIRRILEENYQPLKDQGYTIIQKSTTERKFFIIPNRIETDTEIAVRCTCSDFFFTWAWYNADHKCLIGLRPPTYKRLYTDDRGRFRTLRNPHRIPGMCKHLLLFLALLMKGGLIQNLPTLTSSASKATNKLEMVSRSDVYNLLVGLKEELKDANQIRQGFGN